MKLKALQKAKQSREEWSHHIKAGLFNFSFFFSIFLFFNFGLFIYSPNIFQNQAQQIQKEIRKEFADLHEFLRYEEAIRIAALMEEEEEKSRIIKMQIEELDKSITRLNSSIEAIKRELNSNDLSFLQVSQDDAFFGHCI